MAPQPRPGPLYLGLVLMRTNRATQGIAECERALALDRNLADAHAFIGSAKYLLGRGVETEQHINEALRLSPRDIMAYSGCILPASPRCSWKPTTKRSLGFAEAPRPTKYPRRAFSVSPLPWRKTGELSRRGWQRRPDLRSPGFTIRRVRAVSQATIRRTLPGANAL